MSILRLLSSQVGDRTEYSNRKVVLECLIKPELFKEIAQALKSKDKALLGDCTEVMTGVTEFHPEWGVPHVKALAALLTHTHTRVRWEAMHSIANITPLVPKAITPLLPLLGELIRCDTSVIVRDFAVQAVARYAGTGKHAAQASYPYLRQALVAWNGKQAHHGLNGLVNVAGKMPALRAELHEIAKQYSNSRRSVVRKAAKRLEKAVTTAAMRKAQPRTP